MEKYKFILFVSVLFTITSYSICEANLNDITLNKIDSLLKKSYDSRRYSPDIAINCANQVIDICKSSFKSKRAEALRCRAMAKKHKKIYKEATTDCEQSLKIEEEINNKEGQMASLNLIGNIYRTQRKTDIAVKFYIKSQKIGESLQATPEELGDTYNSLGSIFSVQRKFNEANRFFEKALKIRKTRYDELSRPEDDVIATEKLAGTYQDLGGMYYRMDSLDTSLMMYNKSKSLNETINNKYALGKIYTGIGAVYFKKDDNINAIYYFDKSLSIKKELSDDRGVAVITYNICELSYNEKKYQQAISYCDTSIVYAQPLKDYKVLSSVEFTLSQIAKAQNKPEKALKHYETYTAWNDSLDADKKDIEIQKIISKYEKDIEVTAIEEKYQKQRLIYITSILLTLMAFGFLALYSVSKKKLHQAEKKRRIKEEELRKESEGRRIEGEKLHRQVIKNLEQAAEIQAANTEIDAKLQERTKISSELHDTVCSGLFSAKLHLESMQDKIAEKHQVTFAKGLYLMDDAYNTCREISHELNPPILEKFGLTQAIEDICEKLTTPQTDIQFGETQFDERLSQKQELTLYQSIQELIQNILRHSAATEAHVQLTDYDDSLNILVEDNGKGFDMAEISGGGIGLQKIRTRVKHLGGSMEVDSSPGNGTTVIIDVPKTLSTHEIKA